MSRAAQEHRATRRHGRHGAGALLGVLTLSAAWALVPASQALAWPAPTGAITNYAGTGANADPTAGPALQSGFRSPGDVAVDDWGNVYVADCGHTVDKIAPDGALTVVAGNGSTGPAVPGQATRSPLDCPTSVALDQAGNVFFSDSGEHEIFKVTWNGVLSVVAGTGAAGEPVPGPATSSPLEDPTAIAVDSDGRDIFVADAGDHGRVYEINDGGDLEFIAGNGTHGTPVAGPALQSPLGGAAGDGPTGIAIGPKGVLYLADPSNDVIEEIDTQGLLSVVAGRVGQSGPPTPGDATSSELGDPVAVAVDSNGSVYIADASATSSTIDAVSPGGELTVLTGGGAAAAPTYGGAGTASALDRPTAVAVNRGGAMFIADTANHTIDRVGAATPSQPIGSLTFAAGPSTILEIYAPADQGSSPITGYQIMFEGQGVWQDLATRGINPADTTLTGLIPGVDYTFHVRAVNASGPGPQSVNLYVVQAAAQTRASEPRAVQVTVGASTAAVSWQAPTDAGDPALTGYQITVVDLTPGPTDGRSTQTYTGDVLAATVPGLTLTPGHLYLPGHRYEFLVNARGPAGDGTDSTPVTITTPAAPPAAPTPPAAPPAPAPTPPKALPPLAVPAGQRRSEVPLPADPPTYHGGLRHTVADGRARNGTAAFALTTLGRYHLHAGQAASVASSSLFVGNGARVSTHGRHLLRALAVNLSGARVVTCEEYTDYALHPATARALSRARAAAVCGVLRAADPHTHANPHAYAGHRPAVIGASSTARTANARTVIDITR